MEGDRKRARVGAAGGQGLAGPRHDGEVDRQHLNGRSRGRRRGDGQRARRTHHGDGEAASCAGSCRLLAGVASCGTVSETAPGRPQFLVARRAPPAPRQPARPCLDEGLARRSAPLPPAAGISRAAACIGAQTGGARLCSSPGAGRGRASGQVAFGGGGAASAGRSDMALASSSGRGWSRSRGGLSRGSVGGRKSGLVVGVASR